MSYKICMIGTQFIGIPTDSGGAIEYLSFNMAKGLSEKFNVTFFSVDPSIKSNQNFVIERFPSKKTNGLFFTLFVFFKSVFKKFDAVYVSGCSMIFVALIISKLKGIPLVYHEFNHNPWIKSKNWFYDSLAKFSVRACDYVIIASDCIKREIINQTGIEETKIYKITNFVSLNEFSSQPKKKEKKVLFVGRMVKHKGIDFLIELIKKKNFNHWKIHFVSPKINSLEEKICFSKLNSLKNSVKGKFFLNQNLSRKELIQEYSSASILVLPSSQESFGMVLIEAMASFTPCIAFSVGGTTEIIDDNKNGLLVELNNFKSFEQKLRELMDNENKRISLGLNARKKVEENFSFINVIKEFECFFNKILVKKK